MTPDDAAHEARMSFLGNDARLSVPKRSPEMKRAREASMTAHTVSVEARRRGTRMEEGDQLVAATCPRRRAVARFQRAKEPSVEAERKDFIDASVG